MQIELHSRIRNFHPKALIITATIADNFRELALFRFHYARTKNSRIKQKENRIILAICSPFAAFYTCQRYPLHFKVLSRYSFEL